MCDIRNKNAASEVITTDLAAQSNRLNYLRSEEDKAAAKQAKIIEEIFALLPEGWRAGIFSFEGETSLSPARRLELARERLVKASMLQVCINIRRYYLKFMPNYLRENGIEGSLLTPGIVTSDVLISALEDYDEL